MTITSLELVWFFAAINSAVETRSEKVRRIERDAPRGLDVSDVIERLNAEAVVRDAIRQLRVCN